MTASNLLILFTLGTNLFADGTPDISSLVKQALSGLTHENERRADWGYTVQGERREYESTGKVKSQRTFLWKRELFEGYLIGRVYERNGKPLSAAELAEGEQAARKYVQEQKSMTPKERERRRAEAKKKNDEEDGWIQEFPNALTFKLLGEESINGRPTYLLEVNPKPGYQPKNIRAKVFEKLRGKVWIDKTDQEIAKADAEIFDTVAVGFGILGKVEKGTQFHLTRRRVADGVWLQDSSHAKFNARVVFKSMYQESISRYSDFKHRRDLELLTQKPGSAPPVNTRATQN